MGNFEYEFNTGTSGGRTRPKWFGWVGEAYVRPKFSEDAPWPRVTEVRQETPWRWTQSRALDDVLAVHNKLIKEWVQG